MRVAGPRSSPVDEARFRAARNAVYLVFAGNGFLFANWAARIPQVRSELQVTPGVLGLILLCLAVGSGVGTPLSGLIVSRLTDARTVSVMALVAAAGMAVAAVGVLLGTPAVAAGLVVFGFGSGTWDVAMNVQGAAIERVLGRAILPKFHAGWSIGTVAGAGTGAVMVALGVPVTAHLLGVAVVVAVAVPAAARRFLPGAHAPAPGGRSARRRQLASWTEPRTLLIGLFVLCMALTEGTGNDWLSLAVIDGYHSAAVVGTLTFAIFLAAMTAGRWWGPRLIDQYGRVLVLRVCAVTALAGLVLIEFGTVLPVAMAGALLMGLGTSLGFPVGLSSAADDPAHAATRVSTAASIGYVAFLAGPPAVGFLGNRVGVLHSMWVAAAVLVVAFLLAGATAPLAVGGGPGQDGE
ncbi:MAG TPA: MFS transporter [Streptosporangiaceae bacterium]|jgi:predicted MFS family arabinose efflux permease